MVTFDSKTCPTCQALSGGAFDFDGNPLEQSKVQIKAPTPYPPAHVNCRCTTIPLVEGEPLAQDEYFGDWLGAQDEDYQREVLGIDGSRCGDQQARHARHGRPAGQPAHAQGVACALRE